MTQRVELTVFLYNKKMEDNLGVEMPELPARMMMRVDDVSRVREVANGDVESIRKDRCSISTRFGDQYDVKGSYKEILTLLENHGW